MKFVTKLLIRFVFSSGESLRKDRVSSTFSYPTGLRGNRGGITIIGSSGKKPTFLELL